MDFQKWYCDIKIFAVLKSFVLSDTFVSLLSLYVRR